MKKKSLKDKLYVLNEDNHYKILGIEQNATTEQIHKIYKELAISLHPDRNPNLSQDEKIQLEKIFSKITSSYNLLKNEDERRKYDEELRIRSERAELLKKIQEEKENTKKQEKVFDMTNIIKTAKTVNVEELKKEKAEDFFKRGLDKLNKNDLDSAIDFLKKATEINHNVAKYHSYLGLAMEKKGWHGYAQAEFKIALNYDKNDPIANKHHIININTDNKKEEKISIMSRIKSLFTK
ncbi:MAG: hypothetical protein KatS3mg068_1732 [Candidatus Sericytochromatia bacterium]|nr:MAG: hypothetical protein KatS3mg068_1732 [Candidatus Sericytochromatia bacterium]